MAKFFKTRIENLKKSIPPNVPSRNREIRNEGSKKMKALTYKASEDEDSNVDGKGKKFCKTYGMWECTTDECTTLKALIRQAK